MQKGLLSQATEPQEAAEPEQPQEEVGTASPEEEQLMDQALAEVGNMIYKSDEASASILDMLGTGEEFPMALGMVVSQVIEVVDQKMDLPADFILPMAEAVVMMLVEMADTAGIVETNDEVIEQSLMAAAKNLAQDYDIDPAELQTAAADPELAPEINRVGGMYAGQS
ncbi:MAG: hypothetical protein ACJA1I_000487 [Zhongshania marina]|jgi:hypothetical protein